MERSFETVLVAQCAPTLTGVKPASLFCWQQQNARELTVHWSKELAPFGMALRILKTCQRTGSSLIYLYRADWLREIMADQDNREFLQKMGYRLSGSCGSLFEQLRTRLCLQEDFPHEIGLFLGYPLEDVVGFMEHRGHHYTCSGCWKAYGDPVAAEARFTHYRKCTEACCCAHRAGAPVCSLIAERRLLSA